MVCKTWLPGCLSLFLISEKDQKNRYRAYVCCLVALADFWKSGPKKRMYMSRKTWLPGCLSLFLISEKIQKNRYCTNAGCLVALADFWKLGPKKRKYMARKTRLPGCHSLFLIFYFNIHIAKSRHDKCRMPYVSFMSKMPTMPYMPYKHGLQCQTPDLSKLR